MTISSLELSHGSSATSCQHAFPQLAEFYLMTSSGKSPGCSKDGQENWNSPTIECSLTVFFNHRGLSESVKNNQIFGCFSGYVSIYCISPRILSVSVEFFFFVTTGSCLF